MPPSTQAEAAKLADVTASCRSASFRISEGTASPVLSRESGNPESGASNLQVEALGPRLRGDEVMVAAASHGSALVGQPLALEQRAQVLGLLAGLFLGQVPLRFGPGRRELLLLAWPHLGDLHAALDQFG